MEVCNLLCEGMSDMEIAEHLDCSPYTPQSTTCRKSFVFGVNDRAKVMVACFAEGIVDGSSRKPLPDSLNESERRTAVGLLQATVLSRHLQYEQPASRHD
jgi:hypothetical protein